MGEGVVGGSGAPGQGLREDHQHTLGQISAKWRDFKSKSGKTYDNHWQGSSAFIVAIQLDFIFAVAGLHAVSGKEIRRLSMLTWGHSSMQAIGSHEHVGVVSQISSVGVASWQAYPRSSAIRG